MKNSSTSHYTRPWNKLVKLWMEQIWRSVQRIESCHSSQPYERWTIKRSQRTKNRASFHMASGRSLTSYYPQSGRARNWPPELETGYWVPHGSSSDIYGRAVFDIYLPYTESSYLFCPSKSNYFPLLIEFRCQMFWQSASRLILGSGRKEAAIRHAQCVR